jgi:hypothetical protein
VEPSQEELENNRILRHLWYKELCWDLVRAGKKPTQEQLSDSNFAAAWRSIKNNVVAARVRVKILRDLNKEPSQEEFNDSPALLRAWNEAICWDLIRAGKQPTQEQLSDSNFAAAWRGVIKGAPYLRIRMKHFEDTGTRPTDDELRDNPNLKKRWEKYVQKKAKMKPDLNLQEKKQNAEVEWTHEEMLQKIAKIKADLQEKERKEREVFADVDKKIAKIKADLNLQEKDRKKAKTSHLNAYQMQPNPFPVNADEM